MWWKVGAGAVAGLVVGYFVAPGYALWVVVGVVVGYLAHILLERKGKREVTG